MIFNCSRGFLRVAFVTLLFFIFASCAGQNSGIENDPAMDSEQSKSDTSKKPMTIENLPPGPEKGAQKKSGSTKYRRASTTRQRPKRYDIYSPTPSSDDLANDQINYSQYGNQTSGDAGKSRISVTTEKDLVKFNFDNADLNEVVRSLAEIIGLKYIADPDVQGKVTIHTADGVPKKDLYSVLLRVLEANGFTAVKEGDIYRITTLKGSTRLPLDLNVGSDGSLLPAAERIITQVIRLKYTTPSDMVRIITPFLSDGGTVVAHEDSRSLIVVDKSINVNKAIRLINTFDIDLFSKTNYSFFFLQYAGSDDVIKILNEVFSSSPDAGQGMIKFVPIKRLNAILVLSQNRKVFNRVGQLISKIDSEAMGTEPRIYVYFVKNGEASNLASLLKQIFTDSKDNAAQQTTQSPSIQQPGIPAQIKSSPTITETKVVETPQGTKNLSSPKTVDQPAQNAQPQPAAQPDAAVTQAAATQTLTPSQSDLGQGASGTLKGPVKIVADEIRNALIVEATPYDYNMVRGILDRIDVLPRQVLIEATIAEIKLDDSRDLGTDWTYTQGGGFLDGLQSLTIDGATGLTAMIGLGNEVQSRFHALDQLDKVNILSSPHLLASDNREARIDVSNEIPIASSQTVINSNQPLVTTSVQYRDTGVLLSVTPHINERGLVTLDVFQEVSEQSENVLVAGVEYPSFFKRTVQTSLTVKHGQTIVLGGLIRENKVDRSSGVPWFHNIPVLGFLFGRKANTYSKTELIILLTPRVIVSLDDISTVTEDFERKVKNVSTTILLKN